MKLPDCKKNGVQCPGTLGEISLFLLKYNILAGEWTPGLSAFPPFQRRVNTSSFRILKAAVEGRLHDERWWRYRYELASLEFVSFVESVTS